MFLTLSSITVIPPCTPECHTVGLNQYPLKMKPAIMSPPAPQRSPLVSPPQPEHTLGLSLLLCCGWHVAASTTAFCPPAVRSRDVLDTFLCCLPVSPKAEIIQPECALSTGTAPLGLAGSPRAGLLYLRPFDGQALRIPGTQLPERSSAGKGDC